MGNSVLVLNNNSVLVLNIINIYLTRVDKKTGHVRGVTLTFSFSFDNNF